MQVDEAVALVQVPFALSIKVLLISLYVDNFSNEHVVLTKMYNLLYATLNAKWRLSYNRSLDRM